MTNIRALHLTLFNRAENAMNEVQSQMTSIDRLEKSRTERRYRKRNFQKNLMKWHNHPMALERGDWTVNELETRIKELQPFTGQTIGMQMNVVQQFEEIQNVVEKSRKLMHLTAHIDRTLIRPIAFAHFNGLNDILMTANRFIQLLYNDKTRSMRLYLVLQDGDRMHSDDYIANMIFGVSVSF